MAAGEVLRVGAALRLWAEEGEDSSAKDCVAFEVAEGSRETEERGEEEGGRVAVDTEHGVKRGEAEAGEEALAPALPVTRSEAVER